MSLQVEIKKRFSGFSLEVSFHTETGVLGILGASGSGKSMTLKCIAGIETPDEGRIVLGDRVLFDSSKGINLSPQKRRVGYLFQNYALFPNMTVEANIMAGLQGSRQKKQAAAAGMVERFKLEGLEKRYPSQLSGGQQQRVALARILVYEPDVIMLDEPFSALDYYLKEQLQLEVKEVLEAYQGDTLLVTHSRDEVYRLCERSLILEKGRTVTSGATKTLFDKPGNVTAARLTGCKNISRMERLDAHHLRIPDWEASLETEEEISEQITAIGIRAHQFCLAGEESNVITCKWVDTLKQPFEWDILLKPVSQSGEMLPQLIWWMLDYKQTDLLKKYQIGDLIKIGVKPEDILLLS